MKAPFATEHLRADELPIRGSSPSGGGPPKCHCRTCEAARALITAALDAWGPPEPYAGRRGSAGKALRRELFKKRRR